MPQPGTVQQQADAGNIVSLEDLGIDVGALEEAYGEYLFSLVEVDGEHYGIPTNVNLKSMVWYPKDDFDAAGYQVPTTWDEMLALSDQIVADGGTPWCVGFESGGATGWPATDWMEDIMLRTAGVDTYDQWVTHEIPFNDPAVAAAAEEFGNIMFTDGYVLGGAADTPSISFGSAPLPMFEDPPGCWLHRQATFIIGAAPFPEDAEAGVDYDWFPLPPIDQEGTLYAGEFAVVGTAGARPEVVDFLQQFSDAPIQCAQGADPGVVEDLGQHQRRSRLLREPDPGRLGCRPDRRDRERHRPVRRLGPDAGRGRCRQLLDRDGAVHAGGPGVPVVRVGGDRVELAVRIGGHRGGRNEPVDARATEGAAAGRPLPPVCGGGFDRGRMRP